MKRLESMTDWLSVGTDIKINELRDYLNTFNKQLEPMADDYGKKIESQAREIEDERERNEFYEWSSDEYWKYKETFPRILLNSFHVTAYTLLESEILSLASLIGRKQKQLFDVSDLGSRDYLKTASFYIAKLTGVKSQSFKSWNSIDDGRQLRNIIAHSNGVIRSKHDFDLAKKYEFIDETTVDFPSIRPTQRLSITYEYCQTFLVTLKEFFTELYSAMKVGDFL